MPKLKRVLKFIRDNWFLIFLFAALIVRVAGEIARQSTP